MAFFWHKNETLSPNFLISMETLGGFPNPRPLPATLHPARFARPRALWLRRAKPDSADAIASPHREPVSVRLMNNAG